MGTPAWEGTEMLKGFRQFIMRGNMLDLAVAVVLGAAFGAVVAALVKDLLTPLIAAIVGKPDFSAIAFEVNGSKFLIGDFINALLSFLLVAAAVYFFVVLPMNALMARIRHEYNVSIAEVGDNDLWQSAIVGVAAVANDAAYVQGLLERVVQWIDEHRLDVTVADYEIEMR